MTDWQPIETLVTDGTLRLFHSRNGAFYIAPAVKDVVLTAKQKVELYHAGVWPNADYLPTHWAELTPPTEI